MIHIKKPLAHNQRLFYCTQIEISRRKKTDAEILCIHFVAIQLRHYHWRL